MKNSNPCINNTVPNKRSLQVDRHLGEFRGSTGTLQRFSVIVCAHFCPILREIFHPKVLEARLPKQERLFCTIRYVTENNFDKNGATSLLFFCFTIVGFQRGKVSSRYEFNDYWMSACRFDEQAWKQFSFHQQEYSSSCTSFE